MVSITGEVAIMKHSVTAFCDIDSDDQLILNWGASAVGLTHKDKLIDGSKIEPGQIVVGFWEPGYRCNGGTFFTNLLLEVFGSDRQTLLKSHGAVCFVSELTVPSKSYAGTITRVIGWHPDGSITKPTVNITGIAHITGGGVWGKFREMLPQGVGANLNKMVEPAPILRRAQEMSWQTSVKLPDLQAYGTLHGGCGMMVVCQTSADAETLIKEATHDGIFAYEIGKTTSSDHNEVTIKSQFKEGRTLSSDELDEK
jgi:phosphoribosylformylglycinamidine cyclo-ligase